MNKKKEEYIVKRKEHINQIENSTKFSDTFIITLSSSLFWLSLITLPELLNNTNIKINNFSLLIFFWAWILLTIIIVLI